jgi:hypothetical protein
MAEFALYLCGHLRHEVPPLLYKGMTTIEKFYRIFMAGND